MKLIDVHTHIGLSESDQAESHPEDVLKFNAACGIVHHVIFWMDVASDPTYRPFNDRVIKMATREPKRFTGLCRVQPKLGKVAAAEFERCWKAGLKGLKLHAKSEDFKPQDTHAVLELAQAYKCPVMLHVDQRHDQDPGMWVPIFKKYPNADFILAHGIGVHFRKAAQFAKEIANVWIETSTISYRRTQVILEIAGVEKLMFASDFPYSHPELERLKYELLVKDPQALQKIYYANAVKLWKLKL